MTDPFVGTWILNPAASEFDPNHRPSRGKMTLGRNAEGAYLLTAEGVNAKGETVSERPQTFVPDGRPYPLPDFPGLTTVASLPDARTLRVEARREDGSVAGEGTYVVSDDGQSLVATTAGFDTQLRRFETKTAWERSTQA
ncbi:MAG TPA: hypothetical protein VFZ36_07275 [Vicinamibacterales bacterium]